MYPVIEDCYIRYFCPSSVICMYPVIEDCYIRYRYMEFENKEWFLGHLNDLDFSALMCLSFVTKNPKDCISIILTNFEKKN